MSGSVLARLCLLVMSSLLLATGASADSLSSKLRENMAAATLEVVMTLPKADPLTYEKPLPLELLPLSIREATHVPIGTAFRFGPNQYVSAAHVLVAGIGSQWGAPLLRDQEGRVHAIDKILKYSSREDFVVFSLKEPPRSPVLDRGDEPVPGSTVYAVGNALGDGIIVRDGIHTSSTPEQQDGKWNWLRFSAATSPGNSGGPLLDGKGRVIGVVVAKSPNENLNYALPIARVLDDDKGLARIESRSPFGVPFAPETVVVNVDESFALPLSYELFASSVQAINKQLFDRARAELFAANPEMYFPKGEASVELLSSKVPAYQPRLVIRKANQWEALEPETTERTSLGGNAYMVAGRIADVWLTQMQLPDDAAVADLLAQSRDFMDLFLKGSPAYRIVGTDSVRITSLGPARDEVKYVDSYGRKWMLWTWDLPFLDTRLTAAVLPVPEGFIVLSRSTATSLAYPTTEFIKMAADLIYVRYNGTWPQWRRYLELSSMRPTPLADVAMSLDPAHGFTYRSPRFEFVADTRLMDFSDRNIIYLALGYFLDKGNVVWDVTSLGIMEDLNFQAIVGIERNARPPQSLLPQRRDDWLNLVARRRPYNGVPVAQGEFVVVVTAVTRAAPNPAVAIASDATVIYMAAYSAPPGFSAAELQQMNEIEVEGLRIKEE